VAVFLAVAALVWLWRRPPARLRRLDLSALGVREPAIVQFSAGSCSPCRAAAPKLRAAAAEAQVRYMQVDVGDDPEVARTYGIRTVPTIAVTGRGGRVIEVWTAVPDGDAVTGTARRARGTVVRV
ncbi:MAG TPA: thioredoxin family protein, partial [Actinomycetota bacterium]|nr:thioredoxin family protein [Actinomycetota bacterium]